ncbi:SRPBCC family protein [Phenylobacterium sp.]|jgi:uncharacterized protein YndB with AHSA1/START domain|uniref:SRPBCC family protein n=1 Tax=Phenylobacterium sp. TaxID=1871053 RepID=UPI002F41D9B5
MNPPADLPLAVHGDFRIERLYPHSPARVFRANADAVAKRRWFAEGEGFEVLEYALDFRVGGWETSRFRFGDGPEICNDAQFHVVVPDRRIVFTCRMAIGEAPISVSLSTIEIEPAGDGARFVFVEQGVYFGDPDALKNREAGSRELLEALGRELDRTAP